MRKNNNAKLQKTDIYMSQQKQAEISNGEERQGLYKDMFWTAKGKDESI